MSSVTFHRHAWAFLALVSVLIIAACAPTGASPQQAPAAQPAKPAAVPEKPAAAPASPKATDVRRLTWGSAPIASADYAYGVAAAKVINTDAPSVRITVSETKGAVEGLGRLRTGELHLLTMQHGLGYEAINGLRVFKDSPVPDIRALWISNIGINVFAVRADTGITTLAQLDGRDFAGSTGTYAEVLGMTTLEAIGVRPKWYRGGMDDAVAAFKDRRIDGMVKPVGGSAPDGGLQDVQTATRIRLLNWAPDQVDKVKQKYAFYLATDLPAGIYRDAGNEQPVRTWGGIHTVVAMKGLDPELVYQMVKAVHRNKKPQEEVFPAAREVDFVKTMAELTPLPVHAGALRYIKELGLPVRSEIVPPEAR